MSERIRLITWLRDVHAIPPRDVESLIEDMEHAAEERGRRRGVEERDELRALLREARDYVDPRIPHWQGFRGRIDAALAPRDSAPVNYGTCANFWHPGHGHEIHARREAVGDLSAPHADHVNDSGCLNWKPRDSGKETP